MVAYYTSVSIEKQSIYAEALKRKGAGDYRRQLAGFHIRDIMKPKPLTISSKAGFSEIAEKFVQTRFNYLYVADHGRFIGAVWALHDVKNYLNTPELAKVVIAGDILHDSIPVVRPTPISYCRARAVQTHDGERLPVVSDTATKRLIGTIAKTDVILDACWEHHSFSYCGRFTSVLTNGESSPA